MELVLGLKTPIKRLEIPKIQKLQEIPLGVGQVGVRASPDRDIFPESVSEGFSFSRSSAGVEMSFPSGSAGSRRIEIVAFP